MDYVQLSEALSFQFAAINITFIAALWPPHLTHQFRKRQRLLARPQALCVESTDLHRVLSPFLSVSIWLFGFKASKTANSWDLEILEHCLADTTLFALPGRFKSKCGPELSMLHEFLASVHTVGFTRRIPWTRPEGTFKARSITPNFFADPILSRGNITTSTAHASANADMVPDMSKQKAGLTIRYAKTGANVIFLGYSVQHCAQVICWIIQALQIPLQALILTLVSQWHCCAKATQQLIVLL